MVRPRRVTSLERTYLHDVLKSDFSNTRPAGFIGRLEKVFARTVGAQYAVAMCNGTATLHAALVAAGVRPGDEVIVPPLTMMSTTFSVLHAGAIPVFADVDPLTWTLDPGQFRRRITRKTRAVIPVSLYGCPPDLKMIMKVAKQHRIAVIEDNAQGIGGYYAGHRMGSVGDMASFSFQNSKHLSCGEGGVLVTSKEALAIRARRFSRLGFASAGSASSPAKVSREIIQDPRYERHLSMGWNYQMPEMAAAIALAQTERLDEIVKQRLAVARLYAKAHSGCSWLAPQAIPARGKHSYWSYVLRLNDRAPVRWHRFRKIYMEQGGDGIYSAWQLNYLEPVLRGTRLGLQSYRPGLCPIAESLQPALLQFKTNYLDLSVAQAKARSLARTISVINQLV